ncbi:MAG: tRNA uridine-5-carboxymethylaminomethyl(34) synthesis GTPase MnmE [Campylobacterota bacterium]|nr:tRNA uridine-5-carboxymethylaminomethyl(34) synthesis GTPase MnmE [Campylobacterota bacterium]
MSTNETIAAIATASGVGSIAIIRLSGENSLIILKKLTNKEHVTLRYATLSKLYNSKSELLDEAICIYFKAPHSFTAEDVVELQCHGGVVVAELILKRVLELGARLAQPGEFSKRAFLNGRIDLSEAEAIAKLIESKSEDAVKILTRQMRGELKEYVYSTREEMLEVLAYCEVSIDYAEEDLPQSLIEQIEEKLNNIKTHLTTTLRVSQSRQGLMQGFKVSIVGKPNVGKSSLLNALLSFNRAIVSDIAGTTRDTIEESVKIGSHLIRLVDTAGIRQTQDSIEKIGIERSIEAIENSEIVIALFDGSRVQDDEDRIILDLIEKYKDEKSVITVTNKSDLKQEFEIENALKLSCKSSVEELVKKLKALMDSQNISDEIMLVSLRQIEAVEKCVEAINETFEPLKNQELEFVSFHINDAIKLLSSISRPYEYDEMLDKMFGSFCLGK